MLGADAVIMPGPDMSSAAAVDSAVAAALAAANPEPGPTPNLTMPPNYLNPGSAGQATVDAAVQAAIDAANRPYSPLVLTPGASTLPAWNPPPARPAPTPAKPVAKPAAQPVQAAAPVPTSAPRPTAKTLTASLAEMAPWLAGGSLAVVLGYALIGKK